MNKFKVILKMIIIVVFVLNCLGCCCISFFSTDSKSSTPKETFEDLVGKKGISSKIKDLRMEDKGFGLYLFRYKSNEKTILEFYDKVTKFSDDRKYGANTELEQQFLNIKDLKLWNSGDIKPIKNKDVYYYDDTKKYYIHRIILDTNGNAYHKVEWYRD